jgi:ApaG protein
MKMTTEITHGIRVTVTPEYRGKKPVYTQLMHIFSYRVVIENNSSFTFQLLHRSWDIFDADAGKKEVKGDGVLGKQPVIPQGETYEYSSWCPIKSPIGKMSGFFTVLREPDKEILEVKIPQFDLVVPFILN